jgi:TolB-like protein/class 3 adenylate cyclase/Tfp pilus assembly protein PilF
VVDETVQRRLAAIMVADVVGYSRLMEQDEAATLSALRDRRKLVLEPVISAHGGRIVKMMGDGALIEFASAVNAVASALDLQRKMVDANRELPESRRILLRIGINLGDVVGEGTDIYGEGINVAARLESLAEPGGICISAKVHDELHGKIDAASEDMGEIRLKNIARPIRAYRIGSAAGDRPAPKPGPVRKDDKPSIAVLPFTNMSGDPEQEYFSEGITEDIITEISRFRDLMVIARNSSFAYKGGAVSIAKVGQELGVAYVLEGSVRRSGNRVRITAQLVDAQSGSHIWADRYDREITDMFEVQDEITQKIVGMLAVGLEEDALERAKRKPPENLIAYDHWLRGKRLLWTVGQNNLEARRHFEKAAAVDPEFSRAYSGLSVTYQMEALGFPIASEAAIAYDNAYSAARKALDLDEADYQAHISLAWSLLYRRRDYEGMKKHIDRAILLNPNDADSLANAVYLLALYGDAERAVACGDTAMRLNPRYPDWYTSFYSTALFAAKRYQEALAARIRVPDYFIDSTFIGTAILAQMDRLGEARQWADRAVATLQATPGGRERAISGCIQLLLDNNPFRRQEDRDHFAEAMRKAGVPG